jgi:hypothetical protein
LIFSTDAKNFENHHDAQGKSIRKKRHSPIDGKGTQSAENHRRADGAVPFRDGQKRHPVRYYQIRGKEPLSQSAVVRRQRRNGKKKNKDQSSRFRFLPKTSLGAISAADCPNSSLDKKYNSDIIFSKAAGRIA